MVTAPDPSDEALVTAAVDGDDRAFEQLVLRYQARLVNFLYRKVGDRETAHDLAQEVFVKVHGALDRFDARYKFSTWLFRIGQNTAIDSLRRRRLQVVQPVWIDDVGEEQEHDFASEGPSPYDTSRNLERHRAIRRAIANLPEEYRELVEMRHYAELSYAEIAELADLPLGTVKNKLFRGRNLLKKKLAGYLDD